MLMQHLATHHNEQKTAVKSFVSARLRELGINRLALSALIGKSLSYMSQAEGGTSNFPDELVLAYGNALKLAAHERKQLGDLVRLQNSRRGAKSKSPNIMELSALLDANGSILSDQTLNEIESLIKAELKRRNVSFYRKGSSRGSSGGSPNRMTPQRFLVIHARVTAFRDAAVGKDRGFCCVTDIAEHADAHCSDFQVVWCDEMPKRFGDAYACVETIDGFSTLFVTEELYRKAHANVPFPRHLLAHELSHYVLKHQGVHLLAPALVGTQKTHRLLNNDPAEELEANVGSVLMLVAWKSLMKVRPELRRQVSEAYRLDEHSTDMTYFMMHNPHVKYQLEQRM